MNITKFFYNNAMTQSVSSIFLLLESKCIFSVITLNVFLDVVEQIVILREN